MEKKRTPKRGKTILMMVKMVLNVEEVADWGRACAKFDSSIPANPVSWLPRMASV